MNSRDDATSWKSLVKYLKAIGRLFDRRRRRVREIVLRRLKGGVS